MSRNRKYKMTAISSKFSEKCGQAGSSIDLSAGATITLTLADGSELTRSVAIGE